ncbi:ergothioneine biosynthesis protein EgtB [Lysobacter sp. F6437]|uniref:ergothioneine biosynthesis protein EgtB n=1 Tax=Lysobacter sp. F6437 TaxID=3459296 RepID=UPI00403DBF60
MMSTPVATAGLDRAAPAASLVARYRTVRARSLALAAPLSAEDAMVQSMPDASPAKWHLAHTTWFFERFVLGARDGYRPIEPSWDYLFNSYYQSVGPMHARPQRGLLSRPALAQVLDYRAQVDKRIDQAFERGDLAGELLQRIVLGLQHEQQHQELLLTDIKHAFWCNPLKPAYRNDLPTREGATTALHWIGQDETIIEVGAAAWPDASDVFAYDNESPRHRVLLPAHALASRPVSNAEYRAFIDDGGYRTATLWLSDGWSRISEEGWNRPLYWDEALEREFTLGGLRAIDPHAPVCHLSYYEADAFARWAGARLPTEFEWEHAAAQVPVQGNFVEDDLLHPVPARAPVGAASAAIGESFIPAGLPIAAEAAPAEAADRAPDGSPRQLFGDIWEWTSSAYTAYPGFREMPGALGEYNGKFMSAQQVLRGGSCASARDQLRASYRNFFHAPDRWQFSGLRLARDN